MSIEPIFAAIPGLKCVILPDRNHMNAVGDQVYKDAALAFLLDVAKQYGKHEAGREFH